MPATNGCTAEQPEASNHPCVNDAPLGDRIANVLLPARALSGAIDLSDPERLDAAYSLMVVYLYGTRMAFFEAVNRARAWLDDDRLRLDNTATVCKCDTAPAEAGDESATDCELVLLDVLYSWARRWVLLDPPTIHQVESSVLGLRHCDVPESEHNRLLGPLWARLIRALNRYADRPHKIAPPEQLFEVESARRAVRTNLSQHTSAGAIMVIKHLQANYESAVAVLAALAEYLNVNVPSDTNADVKAVIAVKALVGDDLEAVGTDLMEEHERAVAWNDLLNWVAHDDDQSSKSAAVPEGVLRAAATLRLAPHGIRELTEQ